jgi:uncharacterized OB-fold protein
VIAIIELDEGPRLAAVLREVEPTPDGVQLDMRVVAKFEQRAGQSVPCFVPESAQ